MDRYCVSQVGSNVIYVFSNQDDADEQVRRLNTDAVLRFVQKNDSQALPFNNHSPLLRFPAV
jgi:hypothetical protein